MTKQQYINLRTANDFSIAYHFYQEKTEKYLLSIQEFIMYMGTGGINMNAVYQVATSYYDDKFNLVGLSDRNGQLIKYY